MLLAVDIGNTNVTTGLFRNGVLVAKRRAATRDMTADELELLLDGLLRLDGLDLSAIAAIACTSVVPRVGEALAVVAGRLGRPLLVAGAGHIPIAIRVDRPAEVGADRLVNAFAAVRLYGAPAIVADLGTATTIDAISGEGAFLGGAIAPGPELGLAALADRTAKLPLVEATAPDRAIGRDTAEAMRSGAVLGYQALVEGLVGRIRGELAAMTGVEPGSIRAIMTGGSSAAPWARAIGGIDVIDADLTLRGLAVLYAEVSGGEPVEAELA